MLEHRELPSRLGRAIRLTLSTGPRKLIRWALLALGFKGVVNRVSRYRMELRKRASKRPRGSPTNLYTKRCWLKRRSAILSRVRQGRLRVGFAVSEAHIGARTGDTYTALELGTAMRQLYGWDTVLIPEEHWYELPPLDVLVTMVDHYDLRRVPKNGPITVAWLRNWFEKWTEWPWFNDYDLVLCSSEKATALVTQKGRAPHVLRLATNPERFSPRERAPHLTCDCCFTGSYWGFPRDIENNLQPDQDGYTFNLYGAGWRGHRALGRYWKGFLPYEELPTAYSSTRVVIDDANHVTKPWASLNSRVFDALACGALVLTNCVEGAAEVFGGRLPTYSSSRQLGELIRHYLVNEQERAALVRSLRETVLSQHTYSNRAREFKRILTDYLSRRFRIAIKCPAPNLGIAHQWGDYHFALSLKRALSRLGHVVRVDLLPDWETPLATGDDVVLTLRGLSEYNPKPAHLNLMWNISHPDKVSYHEYRRYDHVFVASIRHADWLARHYGLPASPLLQCTDPSVFYPDPGPHSENVLFVGNSRKQLRTVVRDALEAGLPISVYGADWEGLIPSHCIKGIHIPNDQLRHYYSSCKVLLNDHWPSMREGGFISNRLFDAGACGACVISDRVAGLSELLGDAVLTYDGVENMRQIVEECLRNDEKRNQQGKRLREAVRHHTFDDRARAIELVILRSARQLLREGGRLG